MNITSEIGIIIPSIDKVALMAHPIVEKALLVFTFILHIIPAGILIGSTLLAALLKTQKLIEYAGHRHAYALYRDILKTLPGSLSFTITFGVAPLLFLQALYGPLFYTSTILSAPFWLAILAFIIISYYIFYILGWSGERLLKPLRLPLLLTAFAGILYAAFMFGSNASLMRNPQKFYHIYHSTFYGLFIYINDVRVWLKFIHAIAGSVMIASAAHIIIFYIERVNVKDSRYAAFTAAYLKKAFFTAFIFSAASGFAMFFTSKPEIFAFLTGVTPGAAAMWTAIAAAIVQGTIFITGNDKIFKKSNVILLAFSSAVTVSLMAILRDFIRDAEIKTFFSYLNNPYEWNYIVLAVFFITLAAGAGVCAYMLFGLNSSSE